MAKAVGIAVSSEAVASFCRSAKDERCRLLVGILGQARDRFDGHLRARGAWKLDFEKLVEGMKSLHSDREAVLDAFEKAGRLVASGGETGPREGAEE